MDYGEFIVDQADFALESGENLALCFSLFRLYITIWLIKKDVSCDS